MKRIFYYLLSLLFVSLFLCGCASTDKTEKGDETNAPQNNVYVLEDFSTEDSKNNLSTHVDFGEKYPNRRSEVLTNYTDKNGVLEQGVGKTVMTHGNNCIVVRFNRTAEELSEIFDKIETLTVRMLVIRHNGDVSYNVTVLGVLQSLKTNEWVDFTVTKKELGYVLANGSMTNGVSLKEQFSSNFCSTGLGNMPRMIGASLTLNTDMDVYIDSITCVLNDDAE